MLKILWRLQAAVDTALGFGHRFPPMAPAIASVSGQTVRNDGNSYDLQRIVEDMRILLGVPKFRTSKPKKVTRKFSYTRLLSPVENLVTCQSCGGQHEAHTICGTCYEKVRSLTNDIKRKIMSYNPYKGECQDKKVFVKFNDDQLEDGVLNGKRVIEMDQERPTWFKKIFHR